VVPDGGDDTGSPADIFEGIEEAVLLLAPTERMAVDEKLDLLRAGDDVDVFCDPGFVVPMTQDMDTGLLDIYPTVPHDLVSIEPIFRDAEGVDLAATAVILCPTVMGMRFREDDVDTTCADAEAGSRSFPPIVIPPGHVFDSIGILIVVVHGSVFAFIGGAIAVLVIGRRVVVPIF